MFWRLDISHSHFKIHYTRGRPGGYFFKFKIKGLTIEIYLIYNI